MKCTFPAFLLLLIVLFQLCSCDKQVFRFTGNGNSLHSLMEFIERNEIDLELDVWKASKDTIDLAVHKELSSIFHELAGLKSIDYTILMDSLDAEIKNFAIKQETSKNRPDAGFFDAYRNQTEMNQFLNDLATEYPSIASVFQVGTTTEGRPITGIRLATSTELPSIVYIGCQHAREWISLMTVAYIAQQLCEDYANNNQNALVYSFQFSLIPIVNADGYNYSIISDRMWRKNRETNPGSPCIGVDLNRNWGYEWGGQGASPLPCSDTYRGSGPFSSVETAAVSNYISSLDNVVGYIDFHAYGQYWLFPWGYAPIFTPDNVTQTNLAEECVTSIRSVHNKIYSEGCSAILLYPAAGGSDDWTYSQGVTYSYTVELRDTGKYGFLLPPEEILPNGQEIWAAVQSFASYIVVEQ